MTTDAQIERWQAEIDACGSDRERVELLVRFGEALATAGEAERAFRVYLQALELAPERGDLGAALAALARAANRWSDLFDEVSGVLERTSHVATRVSLCLQLGNWYAFDVGRPDYAQPYYQQVIELDPSNVAVKLSMAAFLAKNGHVREHEQILAGARRLCAGPQEIVRLHVALAELFEQRLGDRARAADHYRQALARDPTDASAAAGLARVGGAR